MKKLAQREWAFIDDILYFMYSDEDFINDRKTFLSYINQLIPNKCTIFHLADKSGAHLLCDPEVYVPGEKNGTNSEYLAAIHKYIENYEEEDFGKWIMLMGKRSVYREMDLIDDNEIRSTGYFNDTYATLNIKYSMQVIASYKQEFQAAIVLGRSEEDGDFTDKELYMMDLLNRHLSLFLYKNRHHSETSSSAGMTIDRKITEIAESCRLTKKETEVITMVVKDGLTNDEICDILCIAPATLNKHLSNIYVKCEVNSRAALIHKVL